MYTFVIHYADGFKIECNHIVSVTHNGSGTATTISGDLIRNTPYTPGKYLWLKSETESFVFDGPGIRVIEVRAE